ncbi:MAG: diaminopimelate epimerase, partial [Bryobacteraceae bacterium]|nr:diaminopimelate epimerase [Bryobacteraceae bacterium]
RLGVGADGLVFLTPEGPGQVRMRYFNSDGSPAALCGNASLCASRLAAYLEMASPDGMVLLTDAGPVRTRCSKGVELAEICLPPFELPRPLGLEPTLGEQGFYMATVGVPHLVVLTEDAEAVDVASRGRELRNHPVFAPSGVNVNFVSPPKGGNGATWLIRTYERGVEAETLACGTGTVAAAYALDVAGLRPLPSDWQTIKGIRLGVAGRSDQTMARDTWLVGEGRLVFTGILG